MARYITASNNFTMGVIGKKSQGRFELQEYKNGLSDLINMIPTIQGGVTKRPGSTFIKDLGREYIQIPFTITQEDAYIVCIGLNTVGSEHYKCIRIFDRSGVEQTVYFVNAILDPTALTPYYRAAANESTGQWIQSTGIVLEGFHYAQNGSVIVLTHSSGNMLPLIIAKGKDVFGTGSVFYVDFYHRPSLQGNYLLPQFKLKKVLRVPYLPANLDATLTLTPSLAAIGTGRTLTASSAFFTANAPGTYVRIIHGTTEGIAIITSATSDVLATIDIIVAFGNNTATSDWKISAWGMYGWPKTVVSYEQRLIFGGNEGSPDTIWGSYSGNMFHMMEQRLLQDATVDVSTINYFGDIKTSDPFSYILASTEANKIQWMSSRDSLFVGTLAGEYIVNGGAAALSNSNVVCKRQTANGGSPIFSIQADQDTIYVSRSGKSLRTLRYSNENGSYVSVDLNILCQEISNYGVTDTTSVSATQINRVCYQPSRNTIWVLTTNNKLISLTYDTTGNVIAWAKHEIAGDVLITGMAAIPNSDSTFDDLYLTVKRVINSATVYYMEKIGNDYDQETLAAVTGNVNDLPRFLDCNVYIHNSPASTAVSGLSHLIGKVVYALADGIQQGPFTVSAGGAITLTTAAEHIIIGLMYTTTLETLKMSAGSELGIALGGIQNVDKVTFRLYKSCDFEFGSKVANLETVDVDDDMFTGDISKIFPGGPSEEVQILVRQTSALPLMILALSFRGSANVRV